MAKISSRKPSAAIAISLIRSSEWEVWIKKQDSITQSWARTTGFSAAAGSHCLIAAKTGELMRILAGVNDTLDIWSIADLPAVLPAGHYRLEAQFDAKTSEALMLGWLLGSYHFDRYKKKSKAFATLAAPSGCDSVFVQRMAEAICETRDLINTPANDMGPAELARACKGVAMTYGAEYREIVGEALLKQNYPAIYEVGKASTRAPRLVDIRWGSSQHPKVTLVGKGVCFDSGGLDIKPSSGMKLMKKDMGGAACILALAHMIMERKLPVRLRVLIPAVENSISGNAYRPMDIIKTRKGLSVEIGNTDAEGRIILCDALYEADTENPDLLVDFATLTGAARTALGTDIPAFFTPDDAIASKLLAHSQQQKDPLWRLPLWQEYRSMLNSASADINSAPDGPYAGAITAALYLKEFVQKTSAWIHVDMMAWNLSKRPGRPIGAEAMAVRALFAFIEERFRPKQKTGSARKT